MNRITHLTAWCTISLVMISSTMEAQSNKALGDSLRVEMIESIDDVLFIINQTLEFVDKQDYLSYSEADPSASIPAIIQSLNALQIELEAGANLGLKKKLELIQKLFPNLDSLRDLVGEFQDQVLTQELRYHSILQSEGQELSQILSDKKAHQASVEDTIEDIRKETEVRINSYQDHQEDIDIYQELMDEYNKN